MLEHRGKSVKKNLSNLLISPWPAAVTACPGGTDSPGLDATDRRCFFARESGSSDEEKETVTVRRRRRTEPRPEGRERAEAPRRRKPREASTAGGDEPPSGAPMPSAGKLPRSPLLIIVLVLLAVCVLSVMRFLGPQGTGETGATPPPPTDEPAEALVETSPTSLPETFVAPSTSAEGQTWLVMLYQDADDKILEQDIYVDLNEAERVGSSDRVHMVAQVDRFKGGYRGDGDWTSTKRFYVTQDDDLDRVRSQQVADLGEMNMSDGRTLVDFVTWAVETFPADRHVLILSDHGMGWPGGWSDPDPGGRDDSDSPLAARLGDQLYLMELDQALEEIRRRTGVQQFELIGLDACLMGHIEVFSALASHARYAVASQETEPALGWAYTGFLAAVKENPDMAGTDLARLIVESYIEDDQRIVDDEARAELLSRGSPMGGLYALLGGVSAEQVAQQMGQNITLTAVDLAVMPELMGRVNELSFALQEDDQSLVARARTYAQSFTSVFGRDVPPSYIDLGHFVQLLERESDDRDVAEAAREVRTSLSQTVIAEKHGPNKPGATGVSIYFPNSQLYGSPLTGPQSYTVIAERFADASLWDDFLASHYTGRSFDRATGEIAVPEPGATVRGPGSGEIQLSPITLSDDTAAPGRPVVLRTDIEGQNIGHVRLLVGFYDTVSNAIFLADTDYLETTNTRELEGVYYPAWPEDGEFTMAFEWEPLVFAIDDGRDSVVALFEPQQYGTSPEEAVYTVEGIYTYADGGQSRYARLTFRDGVLRHVFGFTKEEGMGAPREIIPQSGDTFTVLEKWLDLDDQGNVAQVARQEGGTLTFGDQMFAWEELDAAAGEYVVGFIVEDLDGNTFETYERVTVE